VHRGADSHIIETMTLWKKLREAAASLARSGPVSAFTGSNPDVEFTIGVIALGAKMAKADGIVTLDEIAAFREVFKVPPDEQENVARIFNLAKRDVAGYEIYARKLARQFSDRPGMLENVLEGLFHIASADGVLHPDEDAYLYEVASEFGFSESAYRCIRSRFVEEEHSNPYEVLGVSPDISDAELKAHYRRLVVENHPDRAMARGLPAEFVAIATQKLAAINEAYERAVAQRRP